MQYIYLFIIGNLYFKKTFNNKVYISCNTRGVFYRIFLCIDGKCQVRITCYK